MKKEKEREIRGREVKQKRMVWRGKENITYKSFYYSSLYVLRLNTNLTYLLELKFSNPNISRTPIDDRNADRSSYQRNRYRISLFPSSSIY